MKVISFSLWGDNPKYMDGIIDNADVKQRLDFYKDWEMWVYHNDSVPDRVLDQLKTLNVILKREETIHSDYFVPGKRRCFHNATWRFHPASDPKVEYFISRDADSRLFIRDELAVKEWIDSGKSSHIIRDHPVGHSWLMNAGMWGCKGGFIPDIKEKFNTYWTEVNNAEDAIDQHFLKDVVYPEFVGKDCFVHDEYYRYEPPATHIKRERHVDDYAFIGEARLGDGTPDGDQRSSIRCR